MFVFSLSYFLNLGTDQLLIMKLQILSWALVFGVKYEVSAKQRVGNLGVDRR